MQIRVLSFVVAGVALAQQVAASPIRVVVVTTHQEISPNLRFGRPTAEANIPAIAQVIRPGVPDQDNNLITNMMMSPGRQGHGCAGRKMREKAIGWANSLRKTFGLPLIEVDHPHPHHHHHRPPPPHHDHHDHDHPPPPPPHPFPHFPPEGPDHDFESVPTFVHPTEGVVNEEAEGGLVHILPFTGAQFDGSGRPSMPPNMPLHQGHFHHFQHLRGPFMKRLHFAIMALGPWEGRAVAFVLGCGIGVLLRMVFVMSIITYRLIRGKKTYRDNVDSGYVYDVVVFDRDAENIVLPPPEYTDEKVMLVAAEESNVKTPVSAEETKA